MPPLTLVQKRALLAAANNVHKAEKEYMKANREFSSVPSWLHWLLLDAAERKIDTARSKWLNVRNRLNTLEQKLGVNGRTINYHLMSKNAIANVIKKRGFGPRLQDKLWRRGLEAEKARARANFIEFSKGRPSPTTNHIGASHRKKTPSPQRRRTPSPARPANNAHRRIHGIGPANNKRITWSRNANGKVSIHKTLRNLNMKLSQAERNALGNMSEIQAMNYIRNLARER